MKTHFETDVLIIGGGPTGMLSAIYLDRLGISSIVVERQPEISQHPKAHELSARSIEILCQLGFTIEELKEEASSHQDASRVQFGHTINHVLGAINLQADGNDEKYKKHLASPVPYLNLSQTALETLMRRHLKECKHSRLLLGYQWEAMEERNQMVESQVTRRADQQALSVHSKYVICADGAGSRSRKALDIPMIGKEKIDDFISVYFEHNLRDFIQHPAKLYWVMNPKAPGTFIAHHIERRWVYHFPIYTPHETRADYTDEVLKERILTALGDTSLPIEIKSVSLWRMTCQIAEYFRSGRAFLVGDAAHRFPPTGGLGMNSGIGDAHNLCWKLAMVIHQKAAESLLETYELERRPVIELNCQESLYNYYKILEVPRSMGLNPKMLRWQAVFLNSRMGKALPSGFKERLLTIIYNRLSKKILSIPQQAMKHQRIKATIQDQIEHFDRIGLDLGYVYNDGAIIPNSASSNPTPQVSQYQASIEPGLRFPHFWYLKDGIRYSAHGWVNPQCFTLLCNAEGVKWWKTNVAALPESIRSIIQIIDVSESFQNLEDKSFV
ncbi:MAG: FAD-dependent monooxygenase, partial [Bacteroidota bacterium]